MMSKWTQGQVGFKSIVYLAHISFGFLFDGFKSWNWFLSFYPSNQIASGNCVSFLRLYEFQESDFILCDPKIGIR